MAARIAPVSPLGTPSTLLRDGDAHPLAPYVRALITVQDRPTVRQWRIVSPASAFEMAAADFAAAVARFQGAA